jgi:hypothetical protein
MKGILDRIEDGMHAVILLEEQGREIIVPVSRLPPGSQVHSWFAITMEEEEIIAIELDEHLADAKAARARNLMDRLRARKSGSRFKRG